MCPRAFEELLGLPLSPGGRPWPPAQQPQSLDPLENALLSAPDVAGYSYMAGYYGKRLLHKNEWKSQPDGFPDAWKLWPDEFRDVWK